MMQVLRLRAAKCCLFLIVAIFVSEARAAEQEPNVKFPPVNLASKKAHYTKKVFEDKPSVLFQAPHHPKFVNKGDDPKSQLVALKVFLGLVKKIADEGDPSRRQSRTFKLTKKQLLQNAVTEVATLSENASQEEIDQFVSDMAELASLFSDGEVTESVTALSGFDFRQFWDVVSGNQFDELLNEMSLTIRNLLSTNPLYPVLRPALDAVEETDMADIIDPDTYNAYMTGQISDSTALSQFFTIISPRNFEFPPKCNTSNAFTNQFPMGTCVRYADCFFFQGESFGTCGLGTGACCVYHQSCDASSDEWISHFTHPEDAVASPGQGSCRFIARARHNKVCQYRLDFLSFNIAGPDVDSVCSHDFMEIFGGRTSIPKLCGDLTGQHIYVHVEKGRDIQLAVYQSSSFSMLRNWNIRITQINCDAKERVPDDCLQYFNTTTGKVASFNRRPDLSPRNLVMNQASNIDYDVCVVKSPGHCALIWEEEGDHAFSLTGDGLEPNMVTGENCTTDFIEVPGGVYRNPDTKELMENDRFCGTQLPKVITNSLPYKLHVVTDKAEEGDRSNDGFSLSFRQVKCV